LRHLTRWWLSWGSNSIFPHHFSSAKGDVRQGFELRTFRAVGRRANQWVLPHPNNELPLTQTMSYASPCQWAKPHPINKATLYPAEIIWWESATRPGMAWWIGEEADNGNHPCYKNQWSSPCTEKTEHEEEKSRSVPSFTYHYEKHDRNTNKVFTNWKEKNLLEQKY